MAILPRDGFGKAVDRIDARRGVHPSGMGVEALIDKKLPPGGGTIDIQALVRLHLGFGAEKESGVRVDQQERVTVAGQFRRDGNAVRSARLLVNDLGPRHLGLSGRAVKGLQILQVNPLNVPANAALAEAHGHPGLKVADDLWVGVGMAGEISV